MLRFDHMPSAFNPTFLFLGEREDLSALARLLHGFSQKPGPVNARASIPDAGGRATLTIIPGEGLDAPYGLRATAEDNHFTWMLNPWQAEQSPSESKPSRRRNSSRETTSSNSGSREKFP